VTGHKKEIRPGVWKLRVSAGLDPVTGKYRYLSKTVEGGPRIAVRALAELVSSSKDSKSAVTLERLIEESNSTSKGLAAKTVQGYREIAKNHIIPALGAKRIEAITRRDLDNFYRRMTEKGLSDARTHHARSD
jgi:hypothetical protein